MKTVDAAKALVSKVRITLKTILESHWYCSLNYYLCQM